jgi:uncharacterized protein
VTLDPQLARTWPVILLALAVAVAYPLIGLMRYRRIEHLPEPLPSPTRLRIYWSLIASQWTLVALTALALASAGKSFAVLGQSLGAWPHVTLASGAGLLALFTLLSVFTTRQLRTAHASDLPSRMRRAGKILPRNRAERGWFVAVAVTAGVCEEILYRGFLPWWIAGLTGSVGLGFGLSAIVFGLGHAYQGRGGVIVTGLLGAGFGAIAWGLASLVPGQVLHVAIDLVNGIAVGRTLERVQTAPAAAAADVDAPAAPPA